MLPTAIPFRPGRCLHSSFWSLWRRYRGGSRERVPLRDEGRRGEIGGGARRQKWARSGGDCWSSDEPVR